VQFYLHICLREQAALPRPAGWILGRQGEGEKGGARERGEKSGRRKEGKGRGGKEKETKGRRRGNEGKEREEGSGREEFCAVAIGPWEKPTCCRSLSPHRHT